MHVHGARRAAISQAAARRLTAMLLLEHHEPMQWCTHGQSPHREGRIDDWHPSGNPPRTPFYVMAFAGLWLSPLACRPFVAPGLSAAPPGTGAEPYPRDGHAWGGIGS